MLRFSVVVLSVLFIASFAYATEKPGIDLGEKLFQSESLGSNGKSCSSCHSGGKGLQEISSYDDATLKEMINFCIRDALKGEMIGLDSNEMNSLLSYLRSFKM
jgi:cytochrome c